MRKLKRRPAAIRVYRLVHVCTHIDAKHKGLVSRKNGTYMIPERKVRDCCLIKGCPFMQQDIKIKKHWLG